MIALLMLQSVFAEECPTTTWDLQSEWPSVAEQIKTDKSAEVSA